MNIVWNFLFSLLSFWNTDFHLFWVFWYRSVKLEWTVFSSSLPHPNNKNEVCFFPFQWFINSPYKTAHYLFIHTKLITEKLQLLTPPGLSTSKWNSFHLNVYGRKKSANTNVRTPRGQPAHRWKYDHAHTQFLLHDTRPRGENQPLHKRSHRDK